METRTGPGSPSRENGTYPYLIQSQYRAGTANHSWDGASPTLGVTHRDETLDLCGCQTRCEDIQRNSAGTCVCLSPTELRFADGLEATARTTYRFPGDGQIVIERELTSISGSDAQLVFEEYFKGCYGTNEYPEDMHGIRLAVEGDDSAELTYEYASRTLETPAATCVEATIPQIHCRVRLEPLGQAADVGRAIEGFLFNPFYTLSLQYTATQGRSVRSCIRLARAR